MCYNFTYTQTYAGNIKEIDLIENGSHIEVTELNKKDYVKAIARYKMTDEIRE